MSKGISIIYGIVLSIISLLYDVGLHFVDRVVKQTYETVPSLLYNTIVIAAVLFLFTFIMLKAIKHSLGYYTTLIGAILCFIISSRIFMHWSIPSLCLIGMSVAFLLCGRESRK